MLSDEVIEKVTERLVNRIEQGNTYILEQIGKSINKIGTLTPSKAQELVQIMRYGGDYDKIVKKLAEITKLNVKEIYKIFNEVAKENYLFAKQFYKYRNKKYIPWDENIQLQNQVRAMAKITADTYANLSNTIAFTTHNKNGKVVYNSLAKTYQNALDTAIINTGQGKETFDSAMRQLIQELVNSGIRTVSYESGRSMRLESAVRMAMQGGLRDMNNQLQQQFGEEFDADGVEISVHENPAPDHMYVQGRQFSKEEFEKFQNDQDAVDYQGTSFPAEFEGHDRRSIGQYNCYHYIFNIVLGINKPLHTNEELQAIIDRNNKGFDFDGKHYTMYEGQQLQRKLETEIRKAKDLQITARATDDDILLNKSQSRINALTKKYNELNNASGLKSQIQRASVSGYHKVKVTEINKPSNFKANEVFVSAKESKMLDDYFIKYYEDAQANLSYMRGSEKEHYEKLLERRKQKYKDETIKLNNIEDCNKLLEKVNTEITGDEIKNTDFRLVSEATETIYKNTIKSPYVMYDLQMNKARLRAEKHTSGVANTSNNVITLNNNYYKNYEKFKDLCKDKTSDGWWSEVAKGNETKVVITHEFGHRLQDETYHRVIFQQQGKAFDYFADKYGETYYSQFLNKNITSIPSAKYSDIKRDLIYEPIRRIQERTGLTQKEIIDKYVSRYGKNGYQEMFAETFARAQLGKSNELSDELMKFLIEIGAWEE